MVECPPPMMVRRWAAFGLDYLLISAYLIVLSGVGLVADPAVRSLFTTLASAEVATFLLVTLPVMLYFTFMEGGPAGATWGKRRLRLRVLGLHSRRAGLPRAAVRSLVKFLPWDLAHASIWLMVLPSRVPPLLPEVGAIAAMGLAAMWVLSPLAAARGVAVYDWASGTRLASAD